MSQVAHSDSNPPTSFAQRTESPSGDIAELTYESLDDPKRLCAAIDAVRRDDAGAIATFLGTTRDNFQGKRVTRLEYQAYTPLAIKTILKILAEWHALSTTNTSSTKGEIGTSPLSISEGQEQKASTTTTTIRSIVIHRLGSVPVGETSIIIAVSSPHRREAFEACEWLLERVKKDVQVWKREWYASRDANGSADEEPLIAKDGEGVGESEEGDSMWKQNF